MKNFTRELKNIMTEDPGVPIMSPDELRARSQTIVILTNNAPDELLALAGPDRKATLLSINPPMITLPYQKGVFKVRPEDIVFENHHSGRDVTEAGAEETPYEKFFSQAMKKFGVSSPIELSPDDTKKFFNYVDKNWEAEEESDGSKSEDGWEDPPKLGGEPSLITPMEGNDNEDANEAVKIVPYTYWNKATADKRAKLLQLAKPGISTKFTKVDYDGLTPMLKKAIEKVFKTKKAQIEIAPAIAAAAGAAGAGAAGKVMDRIGFGDKDEDVSTGKVGKKDKGSYQHAYKLALKKYQIHSADELDTPAERKGFTAYVDRLWKGGEVHEDKKKESAVTEADLDEASRKSIQKQQRKLATSGETQKREKAQTAKLKKRVPGSEKTVAEKNKEKLDAQRKRNQDIIKKKAAQQRQRAEREREQAAKEREREQAGREREREQAAKEQEKDDNGEPDDTDKDKKKKKNGFFKGIKGIAGAIKQAADKDRAFIQSNASIPEGKKQPRNEVSPPDRKHQVKGIKKHMAQKKGKDKIPKTYVDKKTGKRKKTNPWALAWAQYDKYGVPSRIEKD